MHNGLSIIQCMPPEAASALPWFQRMPWIFVLIALAAAAVLVALAWCVRACMGWAVCMRKANKFGHAAIPI